MNSVTLYLAEDGSLWSRPEQATEVDAIAARVKAIEAVHLGPKPEFNHSGVYAADPHKLTDVRQCIAALDSLMREYLPADCFESAEPAHPASYLPFLGRLDDRRLHAISQLWGRLSCIDETGHEWDQPFYALHPDQRPA